ncbi:MAG TPA: alpha/beta fold hydrolase, partial [archaeon]|nr:alpha/beta fold hydrolase [archaeon]
MQERIEFRNSRGQKLAGKMSVPHGKGPFPALVFAHGRGSGKNAKKAVELSKRLGDGFVCFSFDFSGCYESEGKFEDTTITDEINDLKTAIELVRKMPFVKEVHIVGSSLGGLVALLYAAKYNKLKSLVLHCPAFDFRQTYSDKNGKYSLKEW